MKYSNRLAVFDRSGRRGRGEQSKWKTTYSQASLTLDHKTHQRQLPLKDLPHLLPRQEWPTAPNNARLDALQAPQPRGKKAKKPTTSQTATQVEPSDSESTTIQLAHGKGKRRRQAKFPSPVQEEATESDSTEPESSVLIDEIAEDEQKEQSK